jgi:hypothetical protein
MNASDPIKRCLLLARRGPSTYDICVGWFFLIVSAPMIGGVGSALLGLFGGRSTPLVTALYAA